MAPVLLKYVVSFSSQDSRHPAENLLDSNGCQKWLCANGEKSGRLEAEFQMERACTISHLDIGAHFVFSVQVLVGRSSWPYGKEYATLLPSSTFLTPGDCRLAKNRNVIRMFKKEDFDAAAANEKWDRIRFICCQPFRKDVQFGLSLLKIVTDDDKETTNTSDSVTGQTTDDALSSSLRNAPLSAAAATAAASPSFSKNAVLCSSLSQSSPKSPFSPLLKSVREIDKLKAMGVTSIEGQYSRAGQLLLAATSQVVKFKPPSTILPTRTEESHRKEATSHCTPSKKRKTTEDEITEFVNAVDYTKLDLETFTFADLRHQFEKQKFRKLSKEERKVLVSAATKAVEAIVRATDAEKTQVTKESDEKELTKTPSTDKRSADLCLGGLATSLGKEQNMNRAKGNVILLSGQQSSSSDAAGSFVQNKGVKRPSDGCLNHSNGSSRNSLNASELNSDPNHTLDGQLPFQPRRKLVVDQETRPADLVKITQNKHSNSSKSSFELAKQTTCRTNSLNATDNVWLSKSSPIGSRHFQAGSKDQLNKYSSSLVNSTVSACLIVKDQGSMENTELEVQCPLCMRSYPSSFVAIHASSCSL